MLTRKSIFILLFLVVFSHVYIGSFEYLKGDSFLSIRRSHVPIFDIDKTASNLLEDILLTKDFEDIERIATEFLTLVNEKPNGPEKTFLLLQFEHFCFNSNVDDSTDLIAKLEEFLNISSEIKELLSELTTGLAHSAGAMGAAGARNIAIEEVKSIILEEEDEALKTYLAWRLICSICAANIRIGSEVISVGIASDALLEVRDSLYNHSLSDYGLGYESLKILAIASVKQMPSSYGDPRTGYVNLAKVALGFFKLLPKDSLKMVLNSVLDNLFYGNYALHEYSLDLIEELLKLNDNEIIADEIGNRLLVRLCNPPRNTCSYMGSDVTISKNIFHFFGDNASSFSAGFKLELMSKIISLLKGESISENIDKHVIDHVIDTEGVPLASKMLSALDEKQIEKELPVIMRAILEGIEVNLDNMEIIIEGINYEAIMSLDRKNIKSLLGVNDYLERCWLEVLVELVEKLSIIAEHTSPEVFRRVLKLSNDNIASSKPSLIPLLERITEFKDDSVGIEVAVTLAVADYWPLDVLVDSILEEEDPLRIVDDRIAEYKELERELQYRLPYLDNEIELIMYYMGLIDKGTCFSAIDYERYVEMISNVSEFLADNPKYIDGAFALNGYKQFSITGEGITYSDEVQSVVDSQVDIVKARARALISLDLDALLKQGFGSLEDELDFQARVLSYLVLTKSDDPPKQIKNSTLNWFITKGYGCDWVSEDIQDLYANLDSVEERKGFVEAISAAGERLDIIDAIFSVSLLGYQNADKQQRQRFAYLMIESIVAARLESPEIVAALEQSDYDVKLQALDDIYHEHSLGYILERTGIQVDLPSAVEDKLYSRQEAVQTIAQEEVEIDANIDAYTFVPMKFDAIFRGYTFLDCSRQDDYGYPYVWTVHPDNSYYLIKRNGYVLGYIGLSETYISGTEQKVLAVDTLQFHGQEEMIENILNALEQQALQMGFIGIALPKMLAASFNSEVTRQVVSSLPQYQTGQEVVLQYIDQEITNLLMNNYGEDEYHSLFASKVFMLLTPQAGAEEIVAEDEVISTAGDVTVSRVTPNEWEEIENEIIAIEENAFGEEGLVQADYDMAATFEDPASICLVARDGDEIIGYIFGGSLEDYEDVPGVEEDGSFGQENTCYLESRAVLEGYRGQGIGNQLQEEFLRIARERGYQYITQHLREEFVPDGVEILSTHENYYESELTFIYCRLEL